MTQMRQQTHEVGLAQVNAPTPGDGSLKFDAVDNTAGMSVTVRNASHGQSSVYDIPDTGAAAADFVMDEGAQTIAGVKTFTGANVHSGNNTLSGDNEVTGSLQETKTTAVSADSTPTELTFTGGVNLVSQTSDANDICNLPTNVAADIGKVIKVYAVQAFELRSADASATLNGVVIGATNECAIPAGAYCEFKCVADNTWLATTSILANGTHTQLVPDAV